MANPNLNPTRRSLLQSAVTGSMLFPAIVQQLCAADGDSTVARETHFPAQAKNVIFLFMTGDVSEFAPAIRILDENGRVMAANDANSLHLQAPVVCLKLPTDGPVFVEVSRSIFAPRETLYCVPIGDDRRGETKPFDKDSEYDLTLQRWIEQGAKDDAEPVPKVVSLELSNDSFVFESAAAKKVLKVTAVASDGSRRDVTTLARYHSNNASVVDIDMAGHVVPKGPGDSHVFARFNRFTLGAEVICHRRKVSPRRIRLSSITSINLSLIGCRSSGSRRPTGATTRPFCAASGPN